MLVVIFKLKPIASKRYVDQISHLKVALGIKISLDLVLHNLSGTLIL